MAASPGSVEAVVTWTTDEPATSQVEFGTSGSFGQFTAFSAAFVTSHRVVVRNLRLAGGLILRPDHGGLGLTMVSLVYPVFYVVVSFVEYRKLWSAAAMPPL